ncbi:hypothetical protein RB653_005768 [Dictyostelium firmibasis]|uniref:Uncharacterized protein n=1 Tax=Dictyostelium firmibasis TaxID=79012 RepID=A0AAN7YYG8_9MYCE
MSDNGAKLRDAAKSGNEELVKNLISEGPSSILDYKDRTGFTPLHMAAMFGHQKICTLLLEAGASNDIKTIDDETACDVAKTVTLGNYIKNFKK